MTLADLVGSAGFFLIDFDGPICSVFAGHPAPVVADDLRDVIRRHNGGELPTKLAEPHGDPLRLLVDVGELGDDELTGKVANASRDAEVTAVQSAAPTQGADEVLRAASLTGRKVAVVSNNATTAIGEYLALHGMASYVDGIASRFDGMDPCLLKPHPFLLERALSSAGVPRDRAVFIGDSVTDVEAGRAAGIRTIGYANKPGKQQRLTDAGADIVIHSMRALAAELLSTATRPMR
ncbi:phosphoglycolate phosphatase [Actinoplanes lutulentus]|uniref:Phosphoglycolate phosphatase n=1 Tax=Actinoplanes lutulentus TaxID=1287878 RepID=A0A327ZI59_9ACTN|nr:HAD-IA family hydrolase [Actinoplanes lutulentus]MBB2945342.1 phosphoglycolate phosphatase [Actinoplanes lutulentus]RAK40523.1 phosphoglycolate phosphatase [Actinoplanes lutulentus]